MKNLSKINDLPVLWNGLVNADKILILAHGAGAPMDTEFMNFFAENIAALGVRVLRFEFPYMALRRQGNGQNIGRRPPNKQEILLTSWRQIIQYCQANFKAEIYIGGKSMGGRMASMIADDYFVCGLICLGYPFYAAKKLHKPRIEHLRSLKTPTLILQGSRDIMGAKENVETYDLADRIDIKWFEEANHDLVPLKKSGLTQGGHRELALKNIIHFLNSNT